MGVLKINEAKFVEIATPATPSTNIMLVYAKAFDGVSRATTLNDAGTEEALANLKPSSVAVTGTAKTFALADRFVIQEASNAATQTLTIPTNASVAFVVGTEIPVLRLGVGLVTLLGDTGVTVNGVSGGSQDIQTQFQGAVIRKTATNTWVVTGNV